VVASVLEFQREEQAGTKSETEQTQQDAADNWGDSLSEVQKVFTFIESPLCGFPNPHLQSSSPEKGPTVQDLVAVVSEVLVVLKEKNRLCCDRRIAAKIKYVCKKLSELKDLDAKARARLSQEDLLNMKKDLQKRVAEIAKIGMNPENWQGRYKGLYIRPGTRNL